MVIARSRADYKIYPFFHVPQFKGWCIQHLDNKTMNIEYICSLDVYEVESGRDCNENPVSTTDFYNKLRGGSVTNISEKKLLVTNTPISDNNNVSIGSKGTSRLDEWVYKMGAALDKVIPLKGLTNAQRIEIAVFNFILKK